MLSTKPLQNKPSHLTIIQSSAYREYAVALHNSNLLALFCKGRRESRRISLLFSPRRTGSTPSHFITAICLPYFAREEERKPAQLAIIRYLAYREYAVVLYNSNLFALFCKVKGEKADAFHYYSVFGSIRLICLVFCKARKNKGFK